MLRAISWPRLVGLAGATFSFVSCGSSSVVEPPPVTLATPAPTPTPPPTMTETFEGTVTHAYGPNHDNYHVVQVANAGTLQTDFTCDVVLPPRPGVTVFVKVFLYSGDRDYYNGTGFDTLEAGDSIACRLVSLSHAVSPGSYTVRVWSQMGSDMTAAYTLKVVHP
jgi:hypothetical protein